MQSVNRNVKFTNASKPETNIVKTVKANTQKSSNVQFVNVNIPKTNKKSEKNTTQNSAFKDMVTKTNNQTQSKTQTSTPVKTSTSTKTSTPVKTSTSTKTINMSTIPKYSIKFVSPSQMNSSVQNVLPVENVSSIDNASSVQETTLEGMLKAKYPNLKYHVFDASSSYWRTRNDYPHYLLYQDDIDTEALENWKPTGENPFYGSIGGVFTAPKEIKALSSVPVGTTAVVIHPKVQQRMEKEPEYAKEIYDRINKWFEFDAARNEAIMPGITARTSRSVAIGENGEIVNAQSHSQGRFSYSESSSGTDMALDFWTERSLRHKYFMQLQLEGQLRHEMLLYGLTGTPNSSGLFDLAGGTLSAANLSGLMKLSQHYDMPMLSSQQLQEKAEAKAKLTAMFNSGELNILGDTVMGTPLEELIVRTTQEVWGS